MTGSIKSEEMSSHATPFVRGGLPMAPKSQMNTTGGFEYAPNQNTSESQYRNPLSSGGRYLPPI